MERNDIIIIHGTDYKEMAKKVLERADVAGEIGDRRKRVALKPNLVTARDPSAGGTTHGELLDGALEYLREHGFENVAIMEGSWVGDSTQAAFSAAGYREIAKSTGWSWWTCRRTPIGSTTPRACGSPSATGRRRWTI